MPRGLVDPHARTRILDAADRLLVRDGFRRMGIADVAREAGVGKGSVYLHFTSKEDLALSCIDRMAEGVLARLDAIAAGAGPAPRRLRDMLRARVLMRFDYARPHAHSIDQKLAAMREAMLERRNAHFAREAAVLARVLREGARERALRPPRAGDAAALVDATNALLPYSLGTAELGRRAALAARLEPLIDVLLAGLALPGAPRRSTPRHRRMP